jgi:hypothetical protein
MSNIKINAETPKVWLGAMATTKYESIKFVALKNIWFNEDGAYLNFGEFAIGHKLFDKFSTSYNFRMMEIKKPTEWKHYEYLHWNLMYTNSIGALNITLRNRLGFYIVEHGQDQTLERFMAKLSTNIKKSDDLKFSPYLSSELFINDLGKEIFRYRTHLGLKTTYKRVAPILFLGSEYTKKSTGWKNEWVLGFTTVFML